MADFKKLLSAVQAAYRELEPFRKNRNKAVKAYAGNNYGEARGQKKKPLNLVHLATTIYLRNLLSRNPRPLFRTKGNDQLRPVAAKAERVLSDLMDKIGFKHEMDLAALNGMMLMGVAKIALNDDTLVDEFGQQYPYGKPFVKNVDFDDFVFDTCARTMDECSFIGNRYRRPLEEVKNDEMLSADRLNLSGSSGQGPWASEDKVEELSHSGRKADSDYEEYVELCDIYLPRYKKVVTYAWDQEFEMPLRTIDWDGPQHGPYRLLSFSDMPNNLLGVPPVAQWMDLDNDINAGLRKIIRQIERSKHLHGIEAGGEKDGERLQKYNDGDVVKLDNPKGYVPMKIDGPDQTNQIALDNLIQKFNWMAGNLEAIGGLAAQSETLGQDQLIQQSASRQLQEMQGRIKDFIKGVVQDLAWWMWTDPLRTYPVSIPIEGTDLEIPTELTPEERMQNDFMAMNIEIDAYSLQDITPDKMLNMTMQTWNQAIMPGAQGMMQQGMMPNFSEFLESIAKYSNMPELKRLVSYMDPNMQMQQQMATGGGEPSQPFQYKPAKTQHTTVRKNIPGTNRRGSDAVRANLLNGGGIQPKEASALSVGGGASV